MTNHLRGHVSVSSRLCCQLLPSIRNRHSEVGNFGSMVSCEQNIAWFQISMDDIPRMEIRHAIGNIECYRQIFIISRSIGEKREERTSFTEFIREAETP